jgi:uncharacterized protein (DUF1015 family)
MNSDTAVTSRPSGQRGLALAPVDLHLVDQAIAERVVPPPADALDQEQRDALVAAEPLSLLRVLGPEGEGGAAAGRSAGERIRELVAAGRYEPCGMVLAVHELATPEHRQVGLVAGIPLDDVRAGRVRAHEQTRTDRERALAEFLDAAGMDVSPVVLTHALVPELDALLGEVMARPPQLTFSGWQQVRHRVWVVADAEEQARLQAAAEAIDVLTIVDGHHRVAAALASQESGTPGAATTLLAELIPDRDLRMIGFDRRVRVPDPRRAAQVVASLTEVADVRPLGELPPARPTGQHEMLVGTRDGWLSAVFRDPPEQLPAGLPVTLLQDRVLAPSLGIEDPRTDSRIEYVPAHDGLDVHERALHREPGLAFVPRAVTVEELQTIAAAGRILPPKSTYADPKPGPGVLLRLRERAPAAGP